ncbi:fibronectin type III domain-containing protein [Zeaxanthinibacter sp. PT1]|uniref:fibronectin type III domain-containing protein n=1 Tax=Zeaxanthinibacter TaxID=561554 RepID=UPI00234973EC|nr:fibronectin type III domain-containing protein [Zeaxanthinibacter sp. PT1]MDC6350486.1 fibronectin type III domain-containing protein [Zeaxanthinibacter sp. PT1]
MKYTASLGALLVFCFISCSKDNAPQEPVTTKDSPTISTSEVSETSYYSVMIGGTVQSDGGAEITETGVCYGLEPDPKRTDNYQATPSAAKEFKLALEGLETNTVYFARAYAVNSEGTGYGTVKEFKTLNAAASVATTGLSKVYETEVTAKGEITEEGNSEVSARGFCWSTSPSPTLDDDSLQSGEGPGIFEETITGLTPGTTYYLRAYAVNADTTSYSESIEFTTLTEQVAFEGDVVLQTQDEVNVFGMSGYTTITGNLFIGYDWGTESSIRDLGPLSDLRQIGGDLIISNNTSLKNFEGLGKLRSVQGSMVLRWNHQLSDLTALSALTELGSLIINRNNSLAHLDGLESLLRIQDRFYLDGTSLVQVNALSGITYIGGDIHIGFNAALVSIEGLQGITEIYGNLTLEANTQLVSLQGLQNVTKIAGNLVTYQLDQLTDFKALASLSELNGEIRVSWNQNLKNLDGLQGLSALSRPIEIGNNPGLENLEGLNNLLSTGDLLIHNNSSLSSLQGLEALVQVGGSLEISDHPQLTNLSGLGKLGAVSGNLEITANDQITSLSGLKQLESVGGRLVIADNSNLLNFDGLQALVQLGGDLYIGNNYKLHSITALHGLEALPGGLTLSNNTVLDNLGGFGNIRTCHGMYITRMGALSTLDGFQDLEEISGNVTIINNTGLNDFCALQAALNNAFTKSFNASSNAYNPTLADVQAGNCRP